MNAKNQLTLKVLPRYLKAERKEKKRILDEYSANTGYNRKYAIWKLGRLKMKDEETSNKVKRKKERTYGEDVKRALKIIWELCDCICSRRLHPFLPEILRVLKTFGEIRISEETERLLLRVSRSTMDRLLKDSRREKRRRIHGQTKPGTLLKREIPLRVGPWRETSPGYGEIDLVSHCGDSASGEYANTLNLIDIHTSWSEKEAVMGRAQERVHNAIKEIQARLPFRLRGIDSDNDSPFINYQLKRYCDREGITFTRSRPYKKNDNAHVEQKNWTCVRKIFGYIRIDTYEQVDLMRKLFRGPLRLYTNFFLPVEKLIEKKRIGSRTRKKYDKAKTPFQRVLESEDVEEKVKEELTSLYQTLNPVSLKKEIDRILEKIYSLSHKSSYSSKRKVRISDEAVLYSYYG